MSPTETSSGGGQLLVIWMFHYTHNCCLGSQNTHNFETRSQNDQISGISVVTPRSFSDMRTQRPLNLKFSLHTNISSLACTSILASFAHSCVSSRHKSFMQYFCASITAPLRVLAFVLQCFCMVSFVTSSSKEYFCKTSR